MEKMLNWSKFNYLQINWSKTFIMYIKNKKENSVDIPLSVKLFNIDIEIISKFKLLGVIIDKNLNFNDNFENISSKVYSCLFSLKSKFFLSFDTKLQFFKTFILPIFDYCLSLIIYYSKDLRL